MDTPKFNALKFTFGCGCGCDDPTGTAAFCEVARPDGGLIVKLGRDDKIRVSEFVAGNKVRDDEMMTADQVESLL